MTSDSDPQSQSQSSPEPSASPSAEQAPSTPTSDGQAPTAPASTEQAPQSANASAEQPPLAAGHAEPAPSAPASFEPPPGPPVPAPTPPPALRSPQPKWVIPTVTGVVGLLIGLTVGAGSVAAIGFAHSGVVAIGDAPATSSATAAPASTPKPSKPSTPTPKPPELGTRENPYPIGTTLTSSLSGRDEWSVTVTSITLNANEAIQAENRFNDAAPEGMQYALVAIDATYLGVDTGDPGNSIRASFVSTEGKTYDEFDMSVVTPDELFGQNEIYPGASTSGNISILVPSANVELGVFVLSVDFGPKAFFAAQ